MAIRPVTCVNPRFVALVLAQQEVRSKLAEQAGGTALANLRVDHLRNLQLPLPPRAEQDRIVEAIESAMAAVDEGEDEVRRAAAKSQILYASLLDRLLAEGTPCSLKDLISRIEAGKSFRCETRSADADEWGIVKVSAMTWGEFRADENKAISEPSLVNPAWEIKEGDILVSRANTHEYVGASVLVGPCRPQLLLSDKSLRLRPGRGVDAEWLQLALSTPSARAEISSLATGTKDSMRNISQSKLKAVRLYRPSLDRQKELVTAASRMRIAIANLQSTIDNQVARFDQLRRSTLHRAFTGQLVPQDPSDELASELLERIKAEKAEREVEMKEAKKRARKAKSSNRSSGPAVKAG